MADVEPVIRAAQGPVFVTGSLLRHILVMTGAGAIGLMAIFIGDLANIYFLSRLGDEAIVAAVGYASSILGVIRLDDQVRVSSELCDSRQPLRPRCDERTAFDSLCELCDAR